VRLLEFEPSWLLDWKIGGLGAFEDLVDVAGSAPKQISDIGPVRHESAGYHISSESMKRRQLVGDREVCNALLIGKRERVFDRDQRIRALLSRRLECAIEVVRASHLQRLNLDRQRPARGGLRPVSAT
jgi:hypothetical protein